MSWFYMMFIGIQEVLAETESTKMTQLQEEQPKSTDPYSGIRTGICVGLSMQCTFGTLGIAYHTTTFAVGYTILPFPIGTFFSQAVYAHH